ncbi:MAG TPA: hypothetical protein VEA60_06190 [Allosphingosinicella sp.]|nr:hypothetical protein [Allosphingosinicella sp.]
MAGRAQAGRGGLETYWRFAIWGTAAALMLAPAVAARLTDELAWDAADFIIVGVLLAAGCMIWETAVRKSGSVTYAAAVGIAVAAAFLLLLVNGAVGFLGSEDNPVNLVFLTVPAVALGGAIVARFRARDMARALAVTAGAQVAAGALGLALFPDLRGFLIGTAMFVPLWLLSAWLFGRAADRV